jgi:hypothetical protein
LGLIYVGGKRMQRIRILGAVAFAALALGAITASAASAKAKVLHLKTSSYFGFEHVLVPGDLYELEDASEFVAYAPDKSRTECDNTAYKHYNGFNGTLLSNDQKTDEVELTSATGFYNGDGQACKTSIPTGSNTHVYFFGGNPLAALRLGSNLKAEIKANPTEELKVELSSSDTGLFCAYATKKLKGVIVREENGRMLVKFYNQKLTLKAQRSPSCPKTLKTELQFSSWWGEKAKAPRYEESFYIDEEVL